MATRDEGIAALKAGDARRAMELLKQAVQENPRDTQAQAYLGTLYGQSGQFAAAAECFRAASALAPQSAPIRFNLAAALERAGQNAAAAAAYSETLKLDPSHQRARQGLERMGGAATAPQPAAAPPATPAAAPSILDEFAIGDSAPAVTAPASPPLAPAAPAYSAGSPLAGAPPTVAPASYGAPPPLGASPLAGPPAAPPGYGPPAAPASPPMGPPGGMMPLGEWTPPPTAGPPAGPMPLGDWTPPPGAARPVAAPAPWEAPGAGPAGGRPVGAPSGAVLSSIRNQEDGISKSALAGNCYLSGMGMGVWWGLIGAVVVFFSAMLVVKDSTAGSLLPRVITLCFMVLAGGVLAYGVIGLIGSGTDDPEKVCGILGIGLGVLTAGVMMPLALGSIGAYSIGGFIGTTWVSWKMGAAVGSGIAEQQASAFVVAAPGAVVVTHNR